MEVQLIYSLLFYQLLICIKMIQFSVSACVYMTYVCVSYVLCAVAQSCLTVSPWTAARQTSLSMGFSRREYWSGLHTLLQGIFPTQESNLSLLWLLHWQADYLPLSHQGSQCVYIYIYILFHYGLLQDTEYSSLNYTVDPCCLSA